MKKCLIQINKPKELDDLWLLCRVFFFIILLPKHFTVFFVCFVSFRVTKLSSFHLRQFETVNTEIKGSAGGTFPFVPVSLIFATSGPWRSREVRKNNRLKSEWLFRGIYVRFREGITIFSPSETCPKCWRGGNFSRFGKRYPPRVQKHITCVLCKAQRRQAANLWES